MVGKTLTDSHVDALLGIVNACLYLAQVIDEQGCSCRRCLDACVANHIEDALITVVADASDDRQWELGYMFSQCQCVEAAEVGSSSTTTDDDDDVKLRGEGRGLRGERIDLLQRIDDSALYLFTLHNRREEGDLELKAILVFFQLSTEIAIACCTSSGNDGNTLGKQWNAQLTLQVEDTFFLQLADNLLALASHVANRVGGVDVGDNPRETVCFVILRIDT